MRGNHVDPGNRAQVFFPNPKIWGVLKQAVLVSLSALAPVLLNGCAGMVSSTSNNPPSTLEITNAQATSPTTSTAQIVWTTNFPSDSTVNYGTGPSFGYSTPVDPAMVTSHQMILSGLAPDTTYYYQVTSSDSKGHHGKGGGQPFKTLGFTISGTINPATGGSGVTLTLGGAATATTTADTSGSYTFTGLPNGMYTIVPNHSGFTFTPSSQTTTINGANVTGVNFTDTAATVAPTITTQPANQAVTTGQTATFTVVAAGAAPLGYQWQKNGVNVSGATTASYTTPATTTADNGRTFRVVVSNAAGTVTSAAATLTVTTTVVAPSITVQPANQTVTAGQTATFSVAAAGTAPLTYQWKKNGTAIAGATSSSYITPATTSSDSGSSFVVAVSNSAASVTSNTAMLTVRAAVPTVNFSPTSLTFGDQTVGASSSAQFVTFTNTGTVTFTFGTVSITGDFSSAGQGTCSNSLAAGASCTMSVKFTPTATGTRTGTLTVNDNASSAPQVVALAGTGVPAPLTIATTSVPGGTVGQAYSTQLNATGGTSPYTWSVSSGSLSTGLSLSAAGVISGTPTTAGSSTFTATVRDASSQTISSSFTLTVANPIATACALYVSPSGSDSNPGTLSDPLQTAQKAFDSATAGQTVCFRAGTYPQYIAATAGFNQVEGNSGTPGNPIVFTNYPGEIALLQGSTRVNGSYVTFRGTPNNTPNCSATNPCGLIFEGSTGYVLPAVSVCCAVNYNPNFVLFDHVEIRKGTYHAGIYEEGCNNAILGSYVHDNGLQDRNEDNGIYWSVTLPGCINGGLIANNLVEHNYSKGIQLYDGGSTTDPAFVTVTENTSVNNGNVGALVWGDHNVFVNNILYNNNNLSGGAAFGAQAGLYTGTNTLVDHNLAFNPANPTAPGWYQPGGCCISTNNNLIDPLFVNASGLDWHILTSSPAVGFSNLNYVQPVDKDGVSRSSSPAAGAYQH
jgi:Putative Ig domain/Abnormal spindle-like microcephaly-assoc'd, ASPM-SPD-2-Hydin/Immunoglobulin domain